MKKHTTLSLIVLLTGFATTLTATNIILESFSYDVGANLAGQSGGTGLSGSWTLDPDTNTSTFTVVNGLSFTGFQTFGNAMQLVRDNDPDVDNFGDEAIYRPVGANVTAGSTVWQSFLYQPTADVSPGNIHVAVTASTGNADGNNAIGMAPKRYNPGSAPQLGYGDGGSGSVEFSSSLTLGETYLFVARFDGLGTDSQNTSGWILDQGAYTNLLSLGLSETNLTTAAIATANHSRTGMANTPGISDDRYLLLGGPASGNFGVYGAIIDEVRFASDLSSAVPVPEPGVYALLLGLTTLSTLAIRRRQHKRSEQ